jgi:hypothetical protein
MENTQKKADFCDNFRVKNKQKKENTRKRADFFDHFRVKNEKKGKIRGKGLHSSTLVE